MALQKKKKSLSLTGDYINLLNDKVTNLVSNFGYSLDISDEPIDTIFFGDTELVVTLAIYRVSRVKWFS